MKVGNQRPDITRVFVPGLVTGGSLEIQHRLPVSLGPAREVTLINAVILTARRSLDVRVYETEFPNRRIECETMDAMTRGIHHHRTGPVDDVPSGNLFPTLLETVREPGFARRAECSVYRKDRPDRRVHVDVGRAIERVKQQNVLAFPTPNLCQDRCLLFLRRKN